MPKRKQKPRRANNEALDENASEENAASARTSYTDADEIIINESEQYEWLTNQVEDELHKRKTKSRYNSADVCVIGLERIVSDVTDEEFENMPALAIEAKLKLAKMYYERFHEQIVANTTQASAQVIKETTNRMKSIDTMYTKLVAILDDKLQRLRQEESFTNNNASNQPHPFDSGDVRVKKVEIEKFAGDIKKWPQFRSMFEDCFHNRPPNEMKNATKFYHLVCHLVTDSEAYKLIAGLDRTGPNYETAWKTLCDTYGNERKLVNDLVLSFVDLEPVEIPTRETLMNLVISTNTMVQSLQKYKVGVKHWDPILVPLLIRKLDNASAVQWAVKRDKKKIAELEPLLTFIRDRAESMDAEGATAPYRPSHSQGFSKAEQVNNVVSHNGHFRGPISSRLSQKQPTDSSGEYKHDPRTIKKSRMSCYHCKHSHQLYDCTDFSQLSLVKKEERLDELGICVKCLRRGHRKAQCKLRNCDCGGEHNGKLLCPKKMSANLLSVFQSASSQGDDIAASLIATLGVVACDANGNSVKVRAMSDGGSHMCMVSSRLVQQLKLKPKKLSIPLTGAGQYDIKSKAVVDLKIMPAHNGSSEGEWIRAGILTTISSRLPLKRFDISNWDHIEGLPLADTTFNEPDDVDVLLSVEFMARIELEGLHRSAHVDRPIARNTKFGWVIFGALPDGCKYNSMQISHLMVNDDKRIAENLEKLWKIDEVIEQPLLTEEEALCKQIFEETVARSVDGRYIVTMPIMRNPPKFGNSLRAAMARQFTNERRFRKDPELKEKYVQDIQQFIDLDHMELVPINEIHKGDNEIYYIPHHAANSSKFRVVFDGSVKTSSGVALNDILLNGPRLQDDLTVILMRFRSFKVALTTDITKMYRQVLVPEHQRDLLRIVWRENEHEPLRHYRMKRQTYGLKSSAYCCVEALCRCAHDYAGEFPLASRAVLQSFYVDDGTLGANSNAEAEELYRQLNSMLGKGGFPLAKWATNSTHIKSLIGTTASSVDLDLCNESSVLGIKWSPSDDCFKYKLRDQIPNQPPTKRFIVATVARLYDPVGWIAPVVVLGKVLIQEAWRTNCDWDVLLPQHIQEKWREFQNGLVHLSKVSIPRWLGMGSGKLLQMHGFSDASSKSYGICFYARVECDGVVNCNLISAKTKVAPMKGMTIPRLELCAAFMLAQACKQVCSTYDVSMENVTLWTDSSIVIHWLSKCPTTMKSFIATRIEKMQRWTKGAEWKHVRTHDNPADLASRGVIVTELIGNSLWFNGPSWLCESQDKWPASQFEVNQLVKDITFGESDVDLLHVMAVFKGEVVPRIESCSPSGDELLIDRFSSMSKLVRVTARVLRFIDAITVKKQRKRYHSIAIGRDEYLNAQSIWVKYHQAKWFHDELSELCAVKENGESTSGLSRESPILKMTPFIDGHGILRVGGRIKRSLMPFDTKHPIIIHGDGRFARLLALEAHAYTLHGGTQQCMQYIRQRFWITGIRKAVKKVAVKCIPCFRQKRELADQLMGDLPRARVVAGHAFESVGVDYFGPVMVKERTGRGRKTYKSYVALFVCMKSKGVHLDLVTDLTTDAFMACLSRLISLRGSIHEIFSDNATTFHGASNEIQEIYAHWKSVAKSVALEPVKWTFITPLSPSQGGLWERAVRSSKHHLRRVIGTQVLTYEEYTTMLANVSACLNSRPLIALDDDPTTAQALTPAHLIIGRALVGPLQYDYTDVPDNRLLRWRLIQKLSQQYWAQWEQEFVASQIERSKWRVKQGNVRVGDVVLLQLENMPPTHWPLGRIVDLFPGDDGCVRNVEVKVGESTYRRCVNKIAVLPIDDDDDETSEKSN